MLQNLLQLLHSLVDLALFEEQQRAGIPAMQMGHYLLARL